MSGQPIPNGFRRVLLTSAAVLATQMVGSVFNIWYNLTHIRPLLSEAQADHFSKTIEIYNLSIYPAGLLVWVGLMRSLMRAGASERALQRARRRAINLPWWLAAIAAPAWLLTIPVVLLSLHWAPGAIDPRVNLHFTLSVGIGALIALTQGFFVVEIVSQKLWYPVLFRDSTPIGTPGTIPLTMSRRGLLWAVSAVVCPIVSLLLIALLPRPDEAGAAAFPLAVGGLGILFGFISAWMLGRIVIRPVEELRRAAQRVADGQLDREVGLLRADEFGTLIDQFNDMICGLREKQRTEEIFGRSVGAEVARVLLERGGEELAGVEREITVIFADIRDFTSRCASGSARDVVSMLNIFFNRMVDTVEDHHGIVNQFTGDGFMAIFGATGDAEGHADDAIACGRRMLEDLEAINRTLAARDLEPIRIGVGINTGPAIIGSIGTDRRSIYTAVGDTVNVTARIESHTKVAGQSLLFSEQTLSALAHPPDASALPPAKLKGKSRTLTLFHFAGGTDTDG